MPNQAGKAYGLTVLCPLKQVDAEGNSVSIKVKNTLWDLQMPVDHITEQKGGDPVVTVREPDFFFKNVPNTYLARFYVLEDVFYEDYPCELEHLKSKYLVFTSNFYGDLEPYLKGMFDHAEKEIKLIWQDCYGFDKDKITASSFVEYIKKCQVETTFFFNGSVDTKSPPGVPPDKAHSRQDQLKSLYLKQEFSKFVFNNAHKKPEELLDAFKEFVKETKPKENFPRWKAGGTDLKTIVEKG